VAAALAVAAPLLCAAADEPGPAAVTADLYARMSARDLPALLRYLPPAGFTELEPGFGEPRVLAQPAFESLFGSPLSISLRAEDLRVQQFGDVAVVTGVRVGAVGPKDAPPAAARVPFTMVWSHEAQGWRLRHVHLSAPVVR
jgi:ketosteroid isomerase-like protein